jgi:hypothetical protein
LFGLLWLSYGGIHLSVADLGPLESPRSVQSASSLIPSHFSLSLVIFARLSELEVGETDVILSSDNGAYLNYTRVQEALRAQNVNLPSTPRSRLIVHMYNPKNCFHTLNHSLDFNNNVTYVWNCSDSKKRRSGCPGKMRLNKLLFFLCLDPECYTMSCSQNELGILVLLDSAKEAVMGIGSAWPHPVLSGNNVDVQQNLAQYLGVKAGDQVIMMFQLSQYYGKIYQQSVDSYWTTKRSLCKANSSDPR